MNWYYYTIASLPFLDFETDPPFTVEEFLNECKKECTRSDLSHIRKASLIPPDTSAGLCHILVCFYAWERSLRNELVLLRTKGKGIDPGKYIQEGKEQPEPVLVARSAFLNESPLLAEKILSKARWMYLDELEVGHHFDLERLIIYKLRLEILIQKKQASDDRGREMYKMIMEHFENKLVSLESEK